MSNKKAETKEKSLEEVFGELEEVTKRMEGTEVSLEESFALYKTGMDMLKECNDRIDRVEKQVMMIDENGEMHEL